jgi:hypothetical protein
VTGKPTGGALTQPIQTVVTLANEHAASAKQIQWAAATALREINELARERDPRLTVPAASLTLRDSGPSLVPGHWTFLFEGAPVVRKGAKRLPKR